MKSLWVVFALLAVTAEALAQAGGGGRMPMQPVKNNDYARGFNNGWRDAIASNGSRNGYDRNDNYVRHETYRDGYKDGYNFGKGFDGTGSGGLGGYAANAANYQLAYQQERAWHAQTYLADRQRNSSYRASHERLLHPRATPDEQAAFSRARLPAPLLPNEFDPARGVIQWPGVLNRPEFDEDRTKLERFFRQATNDPHGSGLGTQNYHDIEHAVDEMSDKLHTEIAQFKPDEYIAASKFLKSLIHQASLPGAEAK